MAAGKEDQPSWLQYQWKKPTVVLISRNNPNIGKRTGKNVKEGKNIRKNEHGLENFEDYFSDEESESSVASFAFGADSVDRTQYEKENVSANIRSIPKTAFKEPLRPMSPFSASSQNSDASVASERMSLPALTATAEDFSNHVSESQISTSVVNGGGDSLGSISRAESTSSKLEPPNSALQSFRTKKRLTYSAALSSDITTSDSTPVNDETKSTNGTENEITTDMQETMACVEPIVKEVRTKRTSPRKSTQIARVNPETQSKSIDEKAGKRRSNRSSQGVSPDEQRKQEKHETNAGLEPRRSSRNRNKEKTVSPRKVQQENPKQSGKPPPNVANKFPDEGKNGLPVEGTGEEDEYDFENEIEAEPSRQNPSKPKSKKSLKNAFEASARTEDSSKTTSQGISAEKHGAEEDENISNQRNSSDNNPSEAVSNDRNSVDDQVTALKTKSGSNPKPTKSHTDTEAASDSDFLKERKKSDKSEVVNVKGSESSRPVNDNGHVSDSSDDDGGFLSLSRKSFVVPESQPNPAEEDDEEFEVANSPLQKKRFSLQPKKSHLTKGKKSLEPTNTQRGRKSQLQKKNTNQGTRKTRPAHSDRNNSSENESQEELDVHGKSKRKHSLKSFVFGDTDNESVATPQKDKNKQKTVRKSQSQSESESEAIRKTKPAKVKTSKKDIQNKSDDNVKSNRSRRKTKQAASSDESEPEPIRSSQGKSPKVKRGKNNKRTMKNTRNEHKDTNLHDASNTEDVPNHSDKESPGDDLNNELEVESVPIEPKKSGKASKPAVRRSRSSLTIVSREPDSGPTKAALTTKHVSPSTSKGAKVYNNYVNLLGDFEEEFETSASENFSRYIDKSVAKTLSLCTTPGKSPTQRKSSASSVNTEEYYAVADVDEDSKELVASPQLERSQKRRHSSHHSRNEGQPSSDTQQDIDRDEEDSSSPVVKKKKKKGKVKQLPLSPKPSKRRKRSAASPQPAQHKRLKQLKGNIDRRGSIVTSTPVVPGARRKSAGFALTPSPERRKGSDDSTPRSILKNSSLPRYSVASPVHFQNVTDSPKGTPVTKPAEKTVKIVEPEEPADPNLRRSKRARCKPLAWYAGERINYNRRKSGAVIVGIINPAEKNMLLQEYIDPVNHNKKNKNPRRKRVQKVVPPQTPRNMSIHGDARGSFESPSAIAVVNPDDNEVHYQECVRTRDTYHFRGPTGEDATADDELVISKFLSTENFSLGQLVIRPLETKDTQVVNCTMVFYVMYGKLATHIHRTQCLLESGDSFYVPPGNTYLIQNLRNDEAKLLFFQIKDKKKRKKRSNSNDR